MMPMNNDKTKPFLEHVASDLLRKYGSDLSQIVVVFPNKRAALFLNAHLSRLSSRPIWSPRYMTISELFRSESPLTVADPIKLVCELHKSYVSQTGIDETLDHFYSWGQLLLSDFDDIDKHLADADRVLANLRDLHEMDSIDYLTEEQKEAIAKFFSSFSADHESMLKERFQRLWSRMADIYYDFNDRLARQQLAYEGALYRNVVENLENQHSDTQYVFVGFNLLLEVESRLFSWLKNEGRARFYWDFDDYYMSSDAGTFIMEHLSRFPNELDRDDESIYSCFTRPKSIAVVSAPTENIQARYAAKWLGNYSGETSPGPETAIVLCDENLLPTVIHCIPDCVDRVNVTTGYPLGQTTAAALVSTLFTLRTQGYQPNRSRYRLRHVNALLTHPYIAELSPQVSALYKELNEKRMYYPSATELMADETTALLFRPLETGGNAPLLVWMCDVLKAVATVPAVSPSGSANEFNIQTESLFRAYTLLNRLLSLVTQGDLIVDVVTLQRLVSQIMQTTTIPFHGEPVEGVQVMGLLETRNLDFDHVLLLSAGEGNIPRGVNDTSFIPYSIRKAYGLTTADHKVAIYSYYFHRLLQRADDITIVYNNSTADGHTGEMSRFVLQLMVEDHHHNIAKQTLQASQVFIPFRPQKVEKTSQMMEKLQARFSSSLSRLSSQPTLSSQTPLLTPTAINRYQRCPLQFYYAYVHDLREPDTVDDDTIDNRIFGNIFHEAARLIYTQLMEKSHQILASDIEHLLRHGAGIERAVDQAIRQELFHIDTPTIPDLSGLQIINRQVIIHYLRQLLTIDSRLAPFTIIGLEADVTMPLETERLTTVVGGRIDRLDRITTPDGERIRVIDYKTGSKVPTPLSGTEAIFQQEQLVNHSDYYLQTFLYSIIVGSASAPAVYLSSAPDVFPVPVPDVSPSGSPTPVSPALIFIQHAGADDYNPVLKFGKEYIDDVMPHAPLFMQMLKQVIDEMFNSDVPFVPTPELTRCRNCPYRMLCL